MIFLAKSKYPRKTPSIPVGSHSTLLFNDNKLNIDILNSNVTQTKTPFQPAVPTITIRYSSGHPPIRPLPSERGRLPGRMSIGSERFDSFHDGPVSTVTAAHGRPTLGRVHSFPSPAVFGPDTTHLHIYSFVPLQTPPQTSMTSNPSKVNIAH